MHRCNFNQLHKFKEIMRKMSVIFYRLPKIGQRGCKIWWNQYLHHNSNSCKSWRGFAKYLSPTNSRVPIQECRHCLQFFSNLNTMYFPIIQLDYLHVLGETLVHFFSHSILGIDCAHCTGWKILHPTQKSIEMQHLYKHKSVHKLGIIINKIGPTSFKYKYKVLNKVQKYSKLYQPSWKSYCTLNEL